MTTETHNDVGVNTWSHTYNYVVNNTVTFLVRFTNMRGLDSQKLVQMKDSLEDAIYTWLASRHLERVVIEVYEPGSDKATERFDLAYDLKNPEGMSQDEIRRAQEKDFEAYHDQILQQVKDIEAPPDECTYRVLVGLKPTNSNGEEPPDVEGWFSTTARSTDHLDRNDLGDAIDVPGASAVAEWLI